jgi:hypothetical protein
LGTEFFSKGKLGFFEGIKKRGGLEEKFSCIKWKTKSEETFFIE